MKILLTRKICRLVDSTSSAFTLCSFLNKYKHTTLNIKKKLSREKINTLSRTKTKLILCVVLLGTFRYIEDEKYRK